MNRHRWLPAVLLAFSSTACFHQVVQTGRPPGPTIVDRAWVPTYLWGLVAAEPIDVRPECPSGVAVIETEQSFLNGLVGALSFSLYTPLHVNVTCASGPVQR